MSAVDERMTVTTPRPPEDLGFGAIVARESRRRFLNRDGTFNVRREGLRFWESLSAYHYLLTISWSRFFSLVVASYLLTNAVFACIYLLAGPHALQNEISFFFLLRRKEEGDMSADHFAERIPEESLRTRVPGCNNSVRSLADDRLF